MLLTILEILVFMIIAAILGVLLGWVLRGALGSEQAEVSDLRAQLRNLKKQQREKEAASKAERVSTAATTTTVSSASKLAQADRAKPAATKKKPIVKKAPVVKKVAVKESPAKKKTVAKKAAVKKPPTKKKVAVKKATIKKSSANKTAVQMSKSEKIAKQRAAKKDVAGIVSRIGKNASKDDLTQIYGIGPKFSAMLNKMGIRSYAQIAKLRKADIRTISSATGVFSDRIERDDWVAGAKKALKAKK